MRERDICADDLCGLCPHLVNKKVFEYQKSKNPQCRCMKFQWGQEMAESTKEDLRFGTGLEYFYDETKDIMKSAWFPIRCRACRKKKYKESGKWLMGLEKTEET